MKRIDILNQMGVYKKRAMRAVLNIEEVRISGKTKLLEKSVTEGIILILIVLMLVSVVKNARFPAKQFQYQNVQSEMRFEKGVLINPDQKGLDIFRTEGVDDTQPANFKGIDYMDQEMIEGGKAATDLEDKESIYNINSNVCQYPKWGFPDERGYKESGERTEVVTSSGREAAEQGIVAAETKREEEDRTAGESENYEEPEVPPAAVLTRFVCEGSLAAPVCVGAESLNLEGLRLYGIYSNGEKVSIDSSKCTVLGFYTKTPGSYKGMLKYQGKLAEFSYQVAAYQAEIELNDGYIEGANGLYYYFDNYILKEVDSPLKDGYTFCGWYLDEALTRKAEFPYRTAFGKDKIKLYAKWVEAVSPFVVTNGMITGFTGRVENGMIRLPDKGSYGVARDAFVNLKGDLKMIDIPANYTKIEPGAFSGLRYLESIHIDFKNPVYTSIDEAVYTKDKKTLVAYPEARVGVYPMREDRKAEHIGKLAFYNSSLTMVVFPTSIKTIDDYAIGGDIQTVRFTGETLPEYISPRAFGNISRTKCPVIEVPDNCLEEYREMFARIHPNLADAVVGYKS